jgi:hypothetical protein
MPKYPNARWELVEEVLTDNSKVWAVQNVKEGTTINAVDKAAALRIAEVLEKDSVD